MSGTSSLHSPASVGSPFEPGSVARAASASNVSPHSGNSSAATSDAELEIIQETKNQIRALVQEVAQLAYSDLPVAEFYGEFLQRVVSAMVSTSAAIWSVGETGELSLEYQINLVETGISDSGDAQARHDQLLQRIVRDSQPSLVVPRTGSNEAHEPGNPTDFLLVIAPVRVENGVEAVVEVFQRPIAGPATQRGYLRFLAQMSDHLSSFLRQHRLRQLGEQQSLWGRIEEFVSRVHQGLESRHIALTVANDGRQLLECDRVSVILFQGNSAKCLAISGVDAVNRRSLEVQHLEQLAETVSAAGREVWSDRVDHLPPQVEEDLRDYVDQSHSRFIGVIPLMDTRLQNSKNSGDLRPEERGVVGALVGALVLEQFQSARRSDVFSQRVPTIAQHAASALANAREYEGLFLLPLWRALGASNWYRRVRNWPKIATISVALISVFVLLASVPVQFSLSARGKLRPIQRLEIFAASDGIVTEVDARHEMPVNSGDILATLSNGELDAERAKVEGELRTNEEHLRRLAREQIDSRNSADQSRIATDKADREQQVLNLRQQLKLLQDRQNQLIIRSPINGQIVTWRVDELLMFRPVQRGQSLMTVIDPKGNWEIELELPERSAGHLMSAWASRRHDVAVQFQLAPYPDKTFRAQVNEIERVASVSEDAGNAISVRAAINRHELPELRTDTTVTGRIECGYRPLGYVLFRELIESFQTNVWFWL